MIITLSNESKTIERQFMVKFRYLEDMKNKNSYDQYGRMVYTSWVEYTTRCDITEIGKKGEKPIDLRMYSGFSYCSYKDKYDREKGKKISATRAIQLMADDTILTFDEAASLANKI